MGLIIPMNGCPIRRHTTAKWCFRAARVFQRSATEPEEIIMAKKAKKKAAKKAGKKKAAKKARR